MLRRLAVLVAALSGAPVLATDPAQDGAGSAPAAPSVDTETSIASSRSRRIRETPGVVTILPRDELLASGARDLAEVLSRVPGFELGVDVGSAVGAGFRGVWGHEGKILYLLDGVELNDLSYGTFPLLRHLNVEQVERVEIIRGPGSALYGGHAELAVVNVVTRAAALDGGSVALVGGRTSTTSSGSSVAGAAGATSGALRFGATASVGGGEASDRTYTDGYGTQADLAGSSGVRPALVTARAVWRWVDVRAVYDDYRLQTIDGYDAVLPAAAVERWRTAALDARATLDLGGDVKLVPRVTYRWEKPWQETSTDFPDLYYDVTNQQLKGRLALEWDTFVGPSVVAGVEGAVEEGRIDHPSVTDPATGEPFLSYAGKPSVSNSWVAGFAEVEYDSRWVNLLAGARVENHSAFGTAFVPRLAATRVFGPFHAKLLASGAYRTPSIENVNYAAGTIEPERTTVYEAEVGWQLADAVSLVANVFDLTVKKPIVYSFTGLDAYANEERTGSRGVEAELQLRHRGSTASLSYAFYSASGNRVPEYAVAGDPKLLAGFAGHKVIATARIRPIRRVVISPTIAWLSERAAFDGTEAPGDPAAGRLGARTYVDLFASWQDVGGARGLELGIGVRDLLDEGTVYVQPYPGGHAPLPGNGREVWLRARYERGFHE